MTPIKQSRDPLDSRVEKSSLYTVFNRIKLDVVWNWIVVNYFPRRYILNYSIYLLVKKSENGKRFFSST